MSLYRKKKVMVVGPWVSGHIQNWLGNEADYDIQVFTCHPFKNHGDYEVNYFFFINQILTFLLFPLYLLYAYFRFKPDITHVHYISSYGLFGLVLPGKKIISIWGSDFNAIFYKNSFTKVIYKKICKIYDVINSPSLDITNKLISIGIDKRKIVTLQYGVNIKLLTDLRNKSRVGVNTDNKVISSIRNWDDVYQIEKIIKFWDSVDTFDLKLRIFGKSNNPDIERKVRKLCEESRKDIEIVGFVGSDRFYELLLESFAFISTPKMDGTPLSVLECLSLDIPGIVTDIPANRYWVSSFNDFYLPVDFNKDDFGKAIKNIKFLDKDRIVHDRNQVVKKANIIVNREKMFKIYDGLT